MQAVTLVIEKYPNLQASQVFKPTSFIALKKLIMEDNMNQKRKKSYKQKLIEVFLANKKGSQGKPWLVIGGWF